VRSARWMLDHEALLSAALSRPVATGG